MRRPAPVGMTRGAGGDERNGPADSVGTAVGSWGDERNVSPAVWPDSSGETTRWGVQVKHPAVGERSSVNDGSSVFTRSKFKKGLRLMREGRAA